ncbi:MAG TPA: response regulator transcription factor [Solirubrobacteraceae bacterium]|nr:response regulator transcription factor [Solirubrobacteraceae bacterium]
MTPWDIRLHLSLHPCAAMRHVVLFRGLMAPLTAICAEDHPLYLSSLVRILRREPEIEIVAKVRDGHAAFEAIEALRPDVAIVDLTMPGLNGADLVEAVAGPEFDVRVLILTADVSAPDVHRALVGGAAGVLSKLVEARELVGAVLAVGRGQAVIAPEAHGSLLRNLRSVANETRPLLTPRETEVLGHVADGLSIPAIASHVFLSRSTVKTHLDHIYRKLDVGDRAAAVATAMRTGILD